VILIHFNFFLDFLLKKFNNINNYFLLVNFEILKFFFVNNYFEYFNFKILFIKQCFLIIKPLKKRVQDHLFIKKNFFFLLLNFKTYKRMVRYYKFFFFFKFKYFAFLKILNLKSKKQKQKHYLQSNINVKKFSTRTLSFYNSKYFVIGNLISVFD
jgi:hypothetical protein